MREMELIIKDIKKLINKKGYIYALCMIIFEDFHIDPEKLHIINNGQRLSNNEASFLIGFLIQNKINFSTPNTPNDLIQLKQETYELMEELHHSFMIPFFKKMKKNIEKKYKIEDFRKEQKDFFGKGDILIEPIFYSGTGVYDFQYLDFLEKKYKYDKEWLLKNKKFNIEESKNIVIQIKNILEKKSKKVNLYGLKEKIPHIIEKNKKEKIGKDWEEQIKKTLPMMELYQYINLFIENIGEEDNLNIDKLRDKRWQSFYKNLIELFVIRKSDFSKKSGINSFLKNFSIKEEENSQFKTIGSFNGFNAKPIIQIDKERYFVPISFFLFEAIYESPFYWMCSEDKSYKDQLGINRGNTGEEITYEILSQVFDSNKIFKSVKIITKKGYDDTDIDVLCILGNKALCVQVKSKKLTEVSRKGDDKQLQKDFQGAVQDAYEQGIISRQKILEKKSIFYNENGKEIKLSEEIDEVYIMGITTENYPSLAIQSYIMLEKEEDNPYPLVLTIFDLELLSHYLNDPYEFLYYLRQRTSLMEYFRADEEMCFLGYHLDQKLGKINNYDFCQITNDFGQLIDRNYYPLKAGLAVSNDNDVIENKWKNNDFEELCQLLKDKSFPKFTDLLFHLYDLAGNTRNDLVKHILKIKNKTLLDNKPHDFTIPPNEKEKNSIGITHMVINNNNPQELQEKLINFCELRKYKCKANSWVGFGSLKDSSNIIDAVAFNNTAWVYDKKLDNLSKTLLRNIGQEINLKKIGRNERCPCGSRLKYKKCCGNNI